jgi:hypothetical protein
MNYLAELKTKEKVQIFGSLNLDDFDDAMDLPGNLIMRFYNDLVLKFETDEEFTIFEEKLGVIADHPYAELESIE